MGYNILTLEESIVLSGIPKKAEIQGEKSDHCSSKFIREIKDSNISACSKVHKFKWALHLKQPRENKKHEALLL